MYGMFGRYRFQAEPAIRGRFGTKRFYKARVEDIPEDPDEPPRKLGHVHHDQPQENCPQCAMRSQIEALFRSLTSSQ